MKKEKQANYYCVNIVERCHVKADRKEEAIAFIKEALEEGSLNPKFSIEAQFIEESMNEVVDATVFGIPAADYLKCYKTQEYWENCSDTEIYEEWERGTDIPTKNNQEGIEVVEFHWFGFKANTPKMEIWEFIDEISDGVLPPR